MRHLPTPFSLRRALCASFAVAALSAFALPAAHAQSYPNKPIKFVVPFSAGSATDNVGRILAQAMGEAMGQPITVENKAGANGILGAEVVKAAPADGYTFLVTTSTTQAANVHLYRKLPYDPVKDFTPIGKIGETGFILMVNTDFPAKDMKEFVAYAKANPGKLAFGHGSSGSLVSAAMLTELAGHQCALQKHSPGLDRFARWPNSIRVCRHRQCRVANERWPHAWLGRDDQTTCR
jgi:tripartite-type tricarboxylate transporter receptor subunit TctC